jgi:hypothetical protein
MKATKFQTSLNMRIPNDENNNGHYLNARLVLMQWN